MKLAIPFTLLAALSCPVFGQGDPNQPKRDNVLSEVDSAFSIASFEESFNPYSGNMTVRLPMIDLSGRGGLDLVLRPYYSSEIYNRTESTAVGTHVASIDPVDHLGGGGWQLHFGKVFNPSGGGSSNPIAPNNPLVIMPDGSTRMLFASGVGELISEDRWKYKLNTSTQRWELTATDGTVYEFADRVGFERAVSYRNEIVAQCVRVRDVLGNEINASYTGGLITSIVDTFGRTVEFTYVSGTDRLQFVRVKHSGTTLQQWQFGYSSVPQVTWAHPFGTRPVYSLNQITPPEGNNWTFEYFTSGTTMAANLYALKKATLPTGGTIAYTYAGKNFNPGCQSLQIQRSVLNTRTTGGRNVVAGTSSYAYANPGSAGMLTTVSGPSGSGYSEVYVSEGYGAFVANDQLLWSVGRLRSKTVSDDIQVVEEDLSWEEGDVLSNDYRLSSNWVSCGALRQDTQIRFVKPITVTRTTSRDGSSWLSTQSSFDAYGNPESVHEDGDVLRNTSLEYWYSTTLNILEGRITLRSEVPGSRARFWFNANGTLQRQNINPSTDTATDGIDTTYLYDAAGQLTQETTDNTGNAVSIRRRQLQNYSFGVPELEILPVSVVSMIDVRVNRDVNALGLVVWEEDGRQGLNYRTAFTYDDLKRVLTVNPPVGHTSSIAYAVDGSTATVTRGVSGYLRRQQYSFDGFGRLRNWEDLERQDERSIAYDSLGRKTQEQLFLGGETADLHEFDDIGRLVRVDHPDAYDIEYAYLGSTVTVIDEELASTELRYAAFGDPDSKRLNQVLDAENKLWTYGYNPSSGLLTSNTAPSGVSGANRSFTYTTDQLLDIETHPESGAINHDYSAGGDRTRTSKTSLNVDFDFDGPGRLYYIDAPTGTNDVEFVYDQASLPTTIDNATADYVQTWDGVQRLTRRTATIDGRTFVSNFDYDDHDRLTEITYPSGRSIVYGYDGEGRVDSITSPGEGAYAPSITYTAHGGLDVLTYGNGALSDLTYDSRFRPTLFNTQLDDLSVGYDPASRINSWSASGVTRAFGYDDLGRLTSATGPAGEAMSFIYNGAGSRSSSIVAGVSETYTYSSSTGRLSSVSGGYANTYGYDATGRLTSASGRTYTWTGLDRLASITVGPTLATYSYDGEGRRVKSSVAGVSRYFVLDPSGKILAEYDGAGLLLVEHIYLGDKCVASRKASDGSRLYFQQDALGSSWQITSGTGSPVQNFRYWPFGEVWDQFGATESLLVLIFQDGFEGGNTSQWSCTVPGSCAEPEQFAEPLYTGKQLDEESGLFYFEARSLDPRIGRFTSPDAGPLVFEDPQSFNRYAYVENSPYKYRDPDGHFLDTVLDVGFMAYDIFDIARSAVRGEGVSGTQWAALGADTIGAAVPFATGGGALIRSAAHADSVIQAASALGHAGSAARGAARWGRPGTLAKHFRDHGADFGASNADDYARMADDFFEQSQKAGLPTKIGPDGTIRVFDPASNTFGAFNPDGTTKTFFKPSRPDYFGNQLGVLLPPSVP